MLQLIAIEIWVFGSLCAWFLAPTRAGKIVATFTSFGVAGLGFLVMSQIAHDTETFTRDLRYQGIADYMTGPH